MYYLESKKVKILLLLLIFAFIYSCASDAEDKCKDLVCDEWLSCNSENGICDKVKDDFCVEDENCNLDENEVCNKETHKCELAHFEVKDGIIIDNKTNLMWQNKNIQHEERPEAITHCENLSFLSYDDWRLADMKDLGTFHRTTNENGIVPNQMFEHCLAEIATDNYVKTKKGAEQYGGKPGDQFNFSGAANTRCVRNK